LEVAKQTLIGKIGDFTEQIRTAFGLLSVDQLASILVNLSFMPEKQWPRVAMIGSRSLAGLSSLSKVRMDDGTQVNRNLVINDLI
jgi:hypothetical protein